MFLDILRDNFKTLFLKITYLFVHFGVTTRIQIYRIIKFKVLNLSYK
jgi:hypothetical protein